jgi:hypothetical protein
MVLHPPRGGWGCNSRRVPGQTTVARRVAPAVAPLRCTLVAPPLHLGVAPARTRALHLSHAHVFAQVTRMHAGVRGARAQDHYALARASHAQPYAYTGARTSARSAGTPADVRHAGPHSCTAVRVVASPREYEGAHSVVDARTARTVMRRVGRPPLGVCGVVSVDRLARVQHPTQTKIINVLGGPNAHARP